jgi:rhodanese-related sulfurtransferase
MIARLMGLDTVTPAALHREMSRDRPTVLDVNSPASWRVAHVPGARHLDPRAFAAADLAADLDQALVFYCSNPLCRKAPLAARRARAMGFRNVRVLAAGISGWQAAGFPVAAGENAEAAS